MTTAIALKPQAPAAAPGPQELTALFGPPEGPFLAGLSKRGRRFLSKTLRWLSRDDQDDVTLAAAAWCWDQRMSYDLVASPYMTTELWFLNAVRDAKKQLLRDRRRYRSLGDKEPSQGDTTLARIEATSALETLAGALPENYRRVVQAEAEGEYSRKELMQLLKLPKHVIDDARARVQQLRRLEPDAQEEHNAARSTPSATNPDGLTLEELGPTTERSLKPLLNFSLRAPEPWIDQAIAAQDGYTPKRQPDPTRAQLREEAWQLLRRVEESEVRAAIEATESRRRSGQMKLVVPLIG